MFSDNLALLWAHPFIQAILWGLIISLGILAIPHFIWRQIGKLPGLTPNWFTLWRVPITYFGIYWYFYMNCNEGFYIIVFSFIIDSVDGKMARAIGNPKPMSPKSGFWVFWEDMNYSGITETGKWLDPLADKLSALPLLVKFGTTSVIWLPAALAIVVLDIMSTLIRLRFDYIQSWVKTNWPQDSLRARWTLRLAKCMESLINRDRGATGLGKMKMVLQLITLLLCHPFHQGWFVDWAWVPNLLLGGALLLATLSVGSRICWRGRLSWLNSTSRTISRRFQF